MIEALWKRAREGDLRGSIDAARKAIGELGRSEPAAVHVELQLVIAFCSLRAGDYAAAARALDDADRAARSNADDEHLALRVEAWRAELAYFQGRHSVAQASADRLVERLERAGDLAYAAFAMRIRLAVLLAHANYAAIAADAERAIAIARASGDDYALVQVLNVLGAAHFDCATSRLPAPHARAHLSSLDPRDAVPVHDEARKALGCFEEARRVAERAGYAFAAWYVGGNIERLQIVLGRADRAVPAIRKRLRQLQARGARYDEIVTRSNLAWALRSLGQHREALHELDAALALVRATGTFNVLLEFLEYDRSIVLGALGDIAESRASYRRYLRLASGRHREAAERESAAIPGPVPHRPLEPHYLKVADRYIGERLVEPITIAEVAARCGVSVRTLEKAFADFRSVTPVAYIRNLRLEHAHEALAREPHQVRDIAARYGFRSATTFSNEYRRRFGMSPGQARRRSQGAFPNAQASGEKPG